MSTLTRAELDRRLSQGKLAPAYLLFGAEGYLRDAAARRVIDAALGNAPLREFNETSFSLASADVQHTIAAAEQLPMMGSRRVVRVTDFSKLREDDEAALARYLARPAETSVVLFVADDLDKRRKFSKTLLESCASVEFAAMSDNEATAWARERLKKLKAEADERTLGHLVALAGTGARRLSTEIDKLATAALPSGRITMELVDSLVKRSREHSNFELTDHLVARDRRRSLETLRRLLDDGVEPVMLIGLLSSSYHKLALAKALMAKGAATNEVRNLAPYTMREEFLALARRTDAREIARSIARIASADVAIKTSLGGGGKGSRLQLEMLVCELTG
ncbi:MAG: DNA polymerase III subunit delta [Acidobacteria bacterium]|nr:DNA polymerase III subunit delta [Acidobacteriota bacterium]MCA1642742.1 DNA polymerase III subunit delta [Acidobacteriota bacterium]